MNELEKASRRIVWTLLITRSFYTGAFILVFTVASIAAVELAGGNRQWTGMPSTLRLVGAAVIGYPAGRLMGAAGRRVGLVLGHLLGIGGAVVSGWAYMQGALPLFLAGLFLMGTSTGIIDMGRYAAAEASVPGQRGRAISLFVLGGTLGSVGGPTLISVSSNLALKLGLPELSGPVFASAALLVIGGTLLFIFLRPEPMEVARQLSEMEPDKPEPGDRGRGVGEVFAADRRAAIAAGAMIFSMMSMVLVMTITPVYMRLQDHTLGAISLVIMAHTMGMMALSFVTGWLVDRVGRMRMIVAGALTLTVACVIAPLQTSTAWLALALFLLGLGWNFCYVAGSTLLEDTLRSNEKARVQGSIESLVNVAAGVGSLGSGLAFAAAGFSFASWGTIALALMPIILIVALRASERPVQATAA